MAGEDGNGGTGNGSQTPKFIEVEIGGKKFQVEESAKDLLMTQADYTRKSQENKKIKDELEAEKSQLRDKLQAGETIMTFLQNNEVAGKLMEAVAANDMKTARALLKEDAGDDDDKLGRVEKEISTLKALFANKNAADNDSVKKAAQREEAKRIVKEKYGLEWDEIFPQMEKIAKETPNSYIPWAAYAGMEKIIQAAAAKAKAEGRKEALTEFVEKSLNSSTMTGGTGGGDNDGPPKDTREAGNRAFLKLMQKKQGQE